MRNKFCCDNPDVYGCLYRRGANGLRWWSTFESLWTTVTLFDRVAPRLRLASVTALTAEGATLREAAVLLGIAPA